MIKNPNRPINMYRRSDFIGPLKASDCGSSFASLLVMRTYSRIEVELYTGEILVWSTEDQPRSKELTISEVMSCLDVRSVCLYSPNCTEPLYTYVGDTEWDSE